MPLTNSQTNLLGLVNQLSQNLATNNGLDAGLSLDLPGLDVDVDLDINVGGEGETDTTPPDTPTTLREVLLSLVNEQVQVTTPFGTVTGTLIVVRSDYIVIIEGTGDQVLVRIDKIEFVSEL